MTVAPVSWICLLVLSVMFALVALPAGSAPDEEQLGRSRGYPMGTGRSWFFDERVRVGSFSHLDQLLRTTPLRSPTLRCRSLLQTAFRRLDIASRGTRGRSRTFSPINALPDC